MKEVGYHGTCSKYRDSIEKEGFDPRKCKHRSDHWLGQGVYFLMITKKRCGGLIPYPQRMAIVAAWFLK